MAQDGGANTQYDTQSLTVRRAQYDSSTPDRAMSQRGSIDGGEQAEPEDKGRTTSTHGRSIKRDGSDSDDDSDSGSEVEDGLLPSFGLDDALVVSGSHGYTRAAGGGGAGAGASASASAVSLGLDTQNMNGFVSREELVPSTSSRNGVANTRKKSSKKNSVKSKGKKLTWEERERLRTRAFAREMAFVVRKCDFSAMAIYERSGLLTHAVAHRRYRVYCSLWLDQSSLEKSWLDSR